MRSKLQLAVLVAGVAGGAWMWSAVGPADPPDIGASIRVRPSQPVVTGVTTADPPRFRDEAQRLLSRPLFSPTRRPRGDPAAVAMPAVSATLPRMTGILIDGARRSAIFDGGGGMPIVLGEGGQFGSFTIQTIEPRQVTINGPDGLRIVRTSFSNDPPPTMASLPPPRSPPPGPPPAVPIILPPGMPTPR